MVGGRILSIVLMGLLASISGLNVPSFSQQENNEDDDTALILSGRINSMLMPTTADTSNNLMNNSMVLPQTMNSSRAASPAATDSAASRAMQYSMARDVAWLLSGDWVLASNSNDGSNSTTFDVEFIKVSTNGTMLHTHRITNFMPLTNASDMASAFNSNTKAAIIIGKADVYFNDELAWSQADTILSIMNGTVLMIDIDSEDIDDHFHDQPIYGTVNMLSKDDGFSITLPTPRSIQEKIEQELAELGINTTQAQSAIETRTAQVEGTFKEEAMNVFNNITNSIRDIIARE
ncbi:MAG: hypothetical protein M3M86_03770 [Thermoproteota archaeon]|nr:hypothetical protein [Thermoproteota archaeon]